MSAAVGRSIASLANARTSGGPTMTPMATTAASTASTETPAAIPRGITPSSASTTGRSMYAIRPPMRNGSSVGQVAAASHSEPPTTPTVSTARPIACGVVLATPSRNSAQRRADSALRAARGSVTDVVRISFATAHKHRSQASPGRWRRPTSWRVPTRTARDIPLKGCLRTHGRVVASDQSTPREWSPNDPMASTDTPRTRYVSTREAAFIGVGAMVGAGIFSLLGTTAEVAGSAVWLSFALAGGIAALQGYSFARLGARYPTAGGLLEYVNKGYGIGHVATIVAWLTYAANIIVTAMVAVSFGSYASDAIAGGDPVWVKGLAVALVIVMTGLNVAGSTLVAKVQSLIVFVVIGILAFFAIVTISAIDPALIAPST